MSSYILNLYNPGLFNSEFHEPTENYSNKIKIVIYTRSMVFPIFDHKMVHWKVQQRLSTLSQETNINTSNNYLSKLSQSNDKEFNITNVLR